MIPIPKPIFSKQTQMAIQQANSAFLTLVAIIPDQSEVDPRSTLHSAFASLAFEHFRSILTLCESRVGIGSAFTLFRPLLDTIIRGEWLYYCASDDDRMQFMNRVPIFSNKGFKQLAREVDEKFSFGSRLSAFNDYYSALCDYTHSGHDAVTQRLAKDGGIEPVYSEMKVQSLLFQATTAIILHYEIFADHTGDHALVEKLRVLFDSIEAP